MSSGGFVLFFVSRYAVEEMIELLNTGVSVETLLSLICFRRSF
jgi:hypothetical protein